MLRSFNDFFKAKQRETIAIGGETERTRGGSLSPSRRSFLGGAVKGSIGLGALFNYSDFSLAMASPAAPGAFPQQQSSKGTKIERMELFKVVVPMKSGSVLSEDATDLEPFWHDFQKGNPEAPIVIIKLYAENGLVGIGEAGRGIPEQSVAKNGNFLIGRDILDLDFSRLSMGLPDAASSPAIEIAVYDLIGKTFGVPVHYLLGGRFQDRVAVTYWTAQRNDADLVDVAKQATELGFQHLKFKAHSVTPVDRLARAVLKATPQLTLGVDYNRTFSGPGSFLPVGKRLEGLPLTVEDPIPGRLDWWIELRQRLDINLALTPGWSIARGQVEETYYSESRIHGKPDGQGIEMFAAAKAGACDTFNLSTYHLREFVQDAYVAEVAGIPIWHGSGAPLGILDTACIHAAAATRSCTLPSDTISYLRESDLLAKPFMSSIKDGYAEVPLGPGLGVELDEEALRRYQVK